MIYSIENPFVYWDEVVITNYEEYYNKNNHLNPRLAINAVTTAFHFHEWIFGYYKGVDHSKLFGLSQNGNLRSYRSLIIDNGCPHFWLIHDLANGSKHMTLNNDKAGVIRSDIEVGTYQGLSWQDLGGSRFGSKYFLVTSDGSRNKVIQHIFENCLEFYMKWWKAYVDSIR